MKQLQQKYSSDEIDQLLDEGAIEEARMYATHSLFVFGDFVKTP